MMLSPFRLHPERKGIKVSIGRFLAAIALVAFGGCAAPSQARSIHGAAGIVTSAACPYSYGLNLSSIDDGCAEAPTTLSYLASNFDSTTTGYGASTGARQNGQVWLATTGIPTTSAHHPWPWNAAGVDYPVGYDTAIGALKDPATATLPTGCTYSSTGNHKTGDADSSPKVACSGTGALDFEGYNMKNASNGCTQLQIQNSSSITVKNNLFGDPTVASGLTPCIHASAAYVYALSCASGAAVLVTQNTFDMDRQEYPAYVNPGEAMLGAVVLKGSGNCNAGSATIIYNAFLEGPQKQYEGNIADNAPWVFDYNYVRNTDQDGSGHAELGFVGPNAGDTIGVNESMEFNTILYGANYGGGDGTFWCTYGQGTTLPGMSLCRMRNNVVVANANPSPPSGSKPPTVSKILMTNQASLVNEMDVQGNYYDYGLYLYSPAGYGYGTSNCVVLGTSTTYLTGAMSICSKGP